jgi:DNA-binding XRE family transcriptional regulator
MKKEDFLKALKKLRGEVGLTQVEMGEKLGIPRRTIEDWERGLKSPPDFSQKAVIKELTAIKKEKGENIED